MATVALIGADGSGKTTIAKRLEESFPLPTKYLYMGWTTESASFALPTSKLVRYLRHHNNEKSKAKWDGILSLDRSKSGGKGRKPALISNILAASRLFNRLVEEWYLQCISWSYQWRGYTVLYDRHFIFEAAFKYGVSSNGGERLTHRLHRWLLNHCFVKPSLIIYLDAPPEVLYKRSEEATIDILKQRQDALLEQGKKLPNFIRVDACQPLEDVYREVGHHIMSYIAPQAGKTTRKSRYAAEL
ncbi:hypothetical protein GWO43_00570 [candidate division KSB1 bacterium]|nr:hypothetical protein [candidate division KSB1 bacterium]NIR68891.1 hypothetical protein [candidate division KSB1 bacterium]NIS22572.1 hypothetical protein [candidate division KSB1 bacterium]NIT69417.1 hypothetical protein [candidate division KSB1 bacterium]NIU23072.1 hypothetical protein [candidate division KSB1 bacterium]